MKNLLIVLVAVVVALPCQAVPSEQAARNAALKQAKALARSGDIASASAALTSKWPTRGGHDRQDDVARAQIELAWSFYNDRQLTTARKLAAVVVQTAQPLLNRKNRSADDTELLADTAEVCEQVLGSREQAQSFYEAVLVDRPDDAASAQKLASLKKQLARVAAKGAK